eukprot:GHVN01051891.1.p2 GENE.GHVN01051891.1~~GHVN01051891.1.p2  ORF type:complete len:108 (+),score=14.23 GHVN01051891.1:677-1000(+)
MFMMLYQSSCASTSIVDVNFTNQFVTIYCVNILRYIYSLSMLLDSPVSSTVLGGYLKANVIVKTQAFEVNEKGDRIECCDDSQTKEYELRQDDDDIVIYLNTSNARE